MKNLPRRQEQTLPRITVTRIKKIAKIAGIETRRPKRRATGVTGGREPSAQYYGLQP